MNPALYSSVELVERQEKLLRRLNSPNLTPSARADASLPFHAIWDELEKRGCPNPANQSAEKWYWAHAHDRRHGRAA